MENKRFLSTTCGSQTTFRNMTLATGINIKKEKKKATDREWVDIMLNIMLNEALFIILETSMCPIIWKLRLVKFGLKSL